MPMNRRLYRSRTDTVIGGVAAGLADYMNADPALIRIAWAILVVITGGAALVAYIIAWIVVPEEPEEAVTAAEPTTDPVTGEVVAPTPSRPAAPARSGLSAGVVIGLGLVLIGVWFLVREFLPPIDWSLIWPLILVGIGAVVLFSTMRRRP